MGAQEDGLVPAPHSREQDSMVINMGETEPPKLSVCVITYNQAKYIRECLQSIVDQQTNFRFEVLVADNGSQDGTTSIVAEFAQRYPQLIRPMLRKSKISGSANYVLVHDQASGEYVAHVDGDDRALPGKLQRQCDVLDSNPDCNAVWHRVNFFDDAGHFCSGNLADVSVFKEGVVQLGDAIRLGFVGVHSSLMYRRSARGPKNASRDYLDLYLTWELLSSGSGRYIDEVLGEYRVGAEGSISRNSHAFVRRLAIDHAEEFLEKLPGQRRNFVLFAIANALIDVRNGRGTAAQLFFFVGRHPVLVTPTDVWRTVAEYRRLNTPWRRQRRLG